MDEYKGLTDKELIERLKNYSIPHGPIVGSTRKLYEKKIYEYETERTQRPSPGGSLSYTVLDSTRTYSRETYDSPRNEEYSEYGSEDPSLSKSYLSHNYDFPRHEGRSTYATEDWDANSSEGSTSSYRHYLSSASSTAPLGAVSARQPITEPYPYSSGQKDGSVKRDSDSYQTIFHRKSPGLSSLGVEPRRAIRPERQTQAAEGATGSDGGTKRFLPLWPQLLLFVLLAGLLAFAYFFLQGGADDNPFLHYPH
ncbi:emerin isoform X2 [Hemicordylus capensis]|uniref:emerin isoform X2 n=1 Tax=Hemicordylus capensis TaxID=884348 RepID=UPI002303B968|nr:emerin isoform X2 [Hemicordylus capensis]